MNSKHTRTNPNGYTILYKKSVLNTGFKDFQYTNVINRIRFGVANSINKNLGLRIIKFNQPNLSLKYTFRTLYKTMGNILFLCQINKFDKK